MSHTAFILFFFLFSFQTFGQQNLILNGDFEEYWQCPDDETQIERCKHVYNPCYHDPPAWSSTSDYFNICSNSSVVSVPVNALGFQNPRSGSGYVGLIISKTNNSNYYNEYIQLEFSEALAAGATYRFQIYANVGNIMEYTTKNIQFKLVSSNLSYTTFLDQVFEPDFRSDTLISDTLNWVPINFEFIATGVEKYIIMGNFDSPTMTDFVFLYDIPNINNPNYSYFYFDDASLIFLKEAAPISFPNIFTPNGDNVNDLFYITSGIEQVESMSIINRWGNIVFETTTSFQWNGKDNKGNDLSDGVYFVWIKSKLQEKNISGMVHLIK